MSLPIILRHRATGWLVAGCFSLAIFHAAVSAKAEPVTVFAAASMTDVLKEVGKTYEKETGGELDFNFAASSVLALQIGEGAPADILFSADESKMDALEEKDLIITDTRVSLLSNALVVVVPEDSTLSLAKPEDLTATAVERIALAEPQTVPAGIYAKAWLERQGLWKALETRVVPTANVRAALSAVGSGNVDAAVVYKTDAAISRRVRVAYEVPLADGPAISYAVAVMAESRFQGRARHFLTWLQENKGAKTTFEKFGFIVRENDER